MPMFEINTEETGTFHKTYRVVSDNEETAKESVAYGEVKAQNESFQPIDSHTSVKELPDCDCDICMRRGPWACQEETDFVGGEVNYEE